MNITDRNKKRLLCTSCSAWHTQQPGMLLVQENNLTWVTNWRKSAKTNPCFVSSIAKWDKKHSRYCIPPVRTSCSILDTANHLFCNLDKNCSSKGQFRMGLDLWLRFWEMRCYFVPVKKLTYGMNLGSTCCNCIVPYSPSPSPFQHPHPLLLACNLMYRIESVIWSMIMDTLVQLPCI